MSAKQQTPARGKTLPEIKFTESDGHTFRLSDFKDRKNLVLLFGNDSAIGLLDDMAKRRKDLEEADGQVIAILDGDRPRSKDWPFLMPAGADPERAIKLEPDEPDGLAVYIADRWGEVFYVSRTGPGEQAPTADNILDWLSFVVMQCEECFPSEWPAV